MYFNTPILFLIFNRLDVAKQVFSEIRKAQPKQLFIAADGGRTAEEHLICTKIRQSILDMIDWECEVHTNFREENAGCGKNVSEAITWFFEYVEEGIILEDDCLPDQSFFHYCSALLSRYQNNENIFVIGGVNFQKKNRGLYSYYFSRYGHIWGWATWKRAWMKYDYSLQNIERAEFLIKLNSLFSTQPEIDFFLSIYDKMKFSEIDTWDYQWTICQLYYGAINIIPNKNLIKNIGFNEFGTHTLTGINGISDLTTYSLKHIRHPNKIKINRSADLFTFYKTQLIYDWKKIKKEDISIISKIIGKSERIIKKFY